MANSAYLLYDSECTVCTRFAKVVRLLDLRQRIITVSLYDRFSLELLRGKLPYDEFLGSFHIVIVDSNEVKVFSAGEGVIQLLGYLPLCSGLKSLVSEVATLRGLVGRIYLQATRLRGSSCLKHVHP